jgi:hypothetical protein
VLYCTISIWVAIKRTVRVISVLRGPSLVPQKVTVNGDAAGWDSHAPQPGTAHPTATRQCRVALRMYQQAVFEAHSDAQAPSPTPPLHIPPPKTTGAEVYHVRE